MTSWDHLGVFKASWLVLHTSSLWGNSWKCHCHWSACFSHEGHGGGSSGSRWWWGRVAHLDSMSTGNASHSALTLPSAATAILNLPPIRVSELRLLTAVTGPAQGDNGGRVVLPLCWGGYICLDPWHSSLPSGVWCNRDGQSEPSDSILWERENRSILPLEEYLCGDDRSSNMIGCCDTRGLLELHGGPHSNSFQDLIW